MPLALVPIHADKVSLQRHCPPQQLCQEVHGRLRLLRVNVVQVNCPNDHFGEMAMLVLERDFADHRVHFALAVVLQQDFDGGVVPEDVSSDRNQRLISNLHNEAGVFEPSYKCI